MAQEKQGEKKAERQILPEVEWERRVKEEARTRPERLARLERLSEELFPGKEKEPLRTAIREGFDTPQWGDYHNEGLFLDTHLTLIIERIEGVCGDESQATEALAGLDEVIALRIRRALQKNPANAKRYALLHDIEKRTTIGFVTLNEKGKRQTHEMPLEMWKAHLGAHPDPVAVRTSFQAFQLKSISYNKHGQKGADTAESYGMDTMIVKGIGFHELGFQDDVTTKTIREQGALTEDEIDFIVAVNFLDQSSSWRKDGKGDTAAMQKIERLLHNVTVIQCLDEMYAQVDLAGYDAVDLKKTIRGLDALSDTGKRFETATAEWSTLLETHRLKRIDAVLFKQRFQEEMTRQGFESEPKILEEFTKMFSQERYRAFPKKAVRKVLYEQLSHKERLEAILQAVEGIVLEILH